VAIRINHKGTAASSPRPGVKAGDVPSKAKRRSFFRHRYVSAGERIFFTTQLSLMLEIGTPLTSALAAITQQTKNIAFKEILLAMLWDVEEGRQLSDAMRRHPQVFTPIFTSMVRAGETGGYLKKILDSMADMDEKRQALISQLRSTLTYPAVLCFLALVVVIFVLVGILPKFAVLFEGKDKFLPLSTRLLMMMSASLRGYWWAYIAGFTVAAAGFFTWLKSGMGRAVIDRLLVSTPLVSRIANKAYTTQLLRTLGNLMESQVPLIEALEVTATTFGNRFYRQFIERVSEHVRQGGRFAQLFAGNPFILESVKQMLQTGEEVGNLPKVLLRLADFYDKEIDRELQAVAALIEPVALIILGTVVGLIVASVILPIFKLASTMQ
jgi:type IV pilus assembly protein PilC